MIHDPNRDIFSDTGGWVVVHRAKDDWEISLIRAAFAHAELPFKVEEIVEDGRKRVAIAVPTEAEEAATELLLRVVEVVDREPTPEGVQTDEAPFIRATPTDLPRTTIAAKEGLGEIVHVEGYGFELAVGPEPHYVVSEEDWEEFTDFSAQRQEFSILLEKEYETLYAWLRGEKRFGDFLRLVERTYRGNGDDDRPEDFLRAAGWMLAVLVGIAALVGVFRWLEGLTTGAAG
ncbi:hypothetical protein CMK11_20050 [Candidatus Poribacteria bacterium]|nr:hypothetical protein [Candidatus Poribacteria bacterium]